MTITFTVTGKTKSAIISAKNMGEMTKGGLKKSMFKIGNYLKDYAVKDLLFKPKGGRKYRVTINGARVTHIASRPGEPPANMTGRLKDSIDFEAVGVSEINFGAGNEDFKAPYPKFLEEGTKKMAKRLYLLRSINNNARNVYVTIESELKKSIKNES